MDGEFNIIRTENGWDWAHIFINERTGTFMAHGSYGTFGYIWTHIGEQTLKQFLAGLDYGYFFGKVSASRGYVFSSGQTVKGMKGHILESRREGSIDRDMARTLWMAIEDAGNLRNEHEFFDAVLSDRDVMKFYAGDYGDLSRNERDPQCVGFWRDIWPLFLAKVKAQEPA